MNILIAYESSGVIRDAFIAAGHNVWSCDVLPGEGKHKDRHIQDDIHNVLNGGNYWLPDGTKIDITFWDLLIAHPDCTYLTNSAAWAFEDKPMINGKPRNIKPGTLIGAARRKARKKALAEVKWLMGLPIPRIAIENPVGSIGTVIRKADQYIQPYEYGHNASKRTGLWVKNLPLLKQARRVNGRIVEWPVGSGKMVERWDNQTDSGQNRLPPSKDRWQERSRTYAGWAKAMVKHWG